MSATLFHPTDRLHLAGHALRRAAARLGAGLVAMAESNPRVIALGRLSEMSDEDLAARGRDRLSEIRRILGPWGMY